MKSAEFSPKAEYAIISFCTAAQTYPNTDRGLLPFCLGLKSKIKKKIKKIPYPEGKDNLKLCSKKRESAIPLPNAPQNVTLPYVELVMGS